VEGKDIRHNIIYRGLALSHRRGKCWG